MFLIKTKYKKAIKNLNKQPIPRSLPLVPIKLCRKNIKYN